MLYFYFLRLVKLSLHNISFIFFFIWGDEMIEISNRLDVLFELKEREKKIKEKEVCYLYPL